MLLASQVGLLFGHSAAVVLTCLLLLRPTAVDAKASLGDGVRGRLNLRRGEGAGKLLGAGWGAGRLGPRLGGGVPRVRAREWGIQGPGGISPLHPCRCRPRACTPC